MNGSIWSLLLRARCEIKLARQSRLRMFKGPGVKSKVVTGFLEDSGLTAWVLGDKAMRASGFSGLG